MIIRNDRATTLLALSLLALLSTGARADLVGHWTFDDVVGDAVPDSSTFGNNGTLMDGASISDDVAGFFGGGNSLFVNGGTQHVLVPDADSLDISTAMTISAWVKPIGNIGYDSIVGKGPADGDTVTNNAGNYEMRVDIGSRRLSFQHQNGVDLSQHYSNGPVVAADTWQQVAVTVGNGLVNFYRNGLPTGSQPLGATFGDINGQPLMIGSRTDQFTVMDGLIDDVRIYDEILSVAEIAALAGATPPVTGTITPVGAFASSEFAGRTAANTINFSGLSGAAHVEDPPTTMWLTAGVADTAPTITYDLGRLHAVDSMRIWNYNEAPCCLARGIKTADIQVAGPNGAGFTTIATIAEGELRQGPGTSTDFSDTFALGGELAQFVRIANVTNYGDTEYTGLSEVQFDGSPATLPLAPLQLPATIHSVSSSLGAPFDRRAEYLVDGSGFFNGMHHTNPDGRMWLNQGTFGTVPEEDFDLDPEIVFDLGEEKLVDHVTVWNYNEFLPNRPELAGRGVHLMDVYVAGEDLMFSLLAGDVELDIAPQQDDVDFGQIVSLGGVNARYIKFDNLQNFPADDPFPGGDNLLVGLSEVQFYTSLAPVKWLGGPGTWATLDKWDSGEVPGSSSQVTVDSADAEITVGAAAEARSLDVTAGMVVVQSTLDVGGAVTVATAGTLVVDGTLNAAASTVAGTLAGGGTINVDLIEVTGTIAPGGTGIGTLTLGSSEMGMDPAATYHAEISLAVIDPLQPDLIEADQIKVISGGWLELGGTLAVSTLDDRADSNSWANPKLKVVRSVFGDIGDTRFANVAAGAKPDTHIGQGAFLREVTYTESPIGEPFVTGVELDVFVALGGDADGDGKVWLSDWAALRANFGNTGTGKTWTEGNFDPWVDDKVWLSDWAALRANFGNASYTNQAAGAAAVPEPGTIAMLLVGLAGLAVAAWRRRRA